MVAAAGARAGNVAEWALVRGAVSPAGTSGCRRPAGALLACAAAALLGAAEPSGACSCAWEGPFLAVAPKAPLVVRGRILRHDLGRAPTMDVLVLETLSGALLDSGLRLQMGDGMHCRPEATLFPVGTEWVIAVNGPGAKPGNGLAVSMCGEYVLRVDGGDVVGSIDGRQGETKRLPLPDLGRRLRHPRFEAAFRARVVAGERFRRALPGGFELVLEPTPEGWEVVVREAGRDENLARLTPPLHFAPNPREIEGWQLAEAPASCPVPYGDRRGPGRVREFVFSPEVGREVAGPDAGRSPTPEDVERVARFAKGTLTIERFALRETPAGCPQIEWLELRVKVAGGG